MSKSMCILMAVGSLCVGTWNVARAAVIDGRRVAVFVEPLLAGELTPGIVVGVFQNGASQSWGFGRFSATDDRVPDGDTLFEIGSISKVFTGVLLADAAQRNVLTVDDPLSRHLPGHVRAPRREDTEIQLWHLATHTSGLPRLPDNFAGADMTNPYATYDEDALWRFLNGYAPLQQPGQTYAYSNLGVGLLGTLVARAATSDYETLLRERIAAPLNMTSTTVSVSSDQAARLAPGHMPGGHAMHNWDFKALVGCGGIRSTVDDLLKFAAAALSKADTPVAKAIRASMDKRHSLPAGRSGMGLGWHIAADGSTRWHNGQTGGYHGALFVDPVHETAVVVLANSATDTVDTLAERLVQMMAGLPVEPPTVRRAIDVAAPALQRLAGAYQSQAGFDLTLTVEDGALMARVTGQDAFEVFAETPTRFFYRVVDAVLEFEIDTDAASAKAVTLLQNGARFRCLRKASE